MPKHAPLTTQQLCWLRPTTECGVWFRAVMVSCGVWQSMSGSRAASEFPARQYSMQRSSITQTDSQWPRRRRQRRRGRGRGKVGGQGGAGVSSVSPVHIPLQGVEPAPSVSWAIVMPRSSVCVQRKPRTCRTAVLQEEASAKALMLACLLLAAGSRSHRRTTTGEQSH